MWPLPEETTTRGTLLMHESYHRIQPALGLEGGGGLGTNAHLDTRAGRRPPAAQPKQRYYLG
jgi:hypothetical protein